MPFVDTDGLPHDLDQHQLPATKPVALLEASHTVVTPQPPVAPERQPFVYPDPPEDEWQGSELSFHEFFDNAYKDEIDGDQAGYVAELGPDEVPEPVVFPSRLYGKPRRDDSAEQPLTQPRRNPGRHIASLLGRSGSGRHAHPPKTEHKYEARHASPDEQPAQATSPDWTGPSHARPTRIAGLALAARQRSKGAVQRMQPRLGRPRQQDEEQPSAVPDRLFAVPTVTELPQLMRRQQPGYAAALVGIPRAAFTSAETLGTTLRQRFSTLWQGTRQFYGDYTKAVDLDAKHDNIAQTVRRVISETKAWGRDEAMPALATVRDWGRDEARPALPAIKQHLRHDLPVKINQTSALAGAAFEEWGREKLAPQIEAAQRDFAARRMQLLGSMGIVGFIEGQNAAQTQQGAGTGSTGA